MHPSTHWILRRKFFTLVIILNGVGIILAAVGKFEYATNHSGALVLGNLLCAVMMRNELFLRFLYLIANALFAKVRDTRHTRVKSPADGIVVVSAVYPSGNNVHLTAHRRYSLWLCDFWLSMALVQSY
jgi:hypothetical protein